MFQNQSTIKVGEAGQTIIFSDGVISLVLALLIAP